MELNSIVAYFIAAIIMVSYQGSYGVQINLKAKW